MCSCLPAALITGNKNLVEVSALACGYSTYQIQSNWDAVLAGSVKIIEVAFGTIVVGVIFRRALYH